MTKHTDIIDATDFCRNCAGMGGVKEKTERGTWLHEDCYACRGTGLRTILVSEVEA